MKAATETLTRRPVPAGPPALDFLVVLQGPPGVEPWARLALGERPFQVGREGPAPGVAGMRVPDASMSRRHFQVGVPRGASRLREVCDLDSKNGLFVDGRPARRAFLAGGEVLRAGDSLFLFQRVTTPERLAEAPADSRLERYVGISAQAAFLRAQVSRLAPARLPVLILGETGVGKELVARLLHEVSGRSGAFRAVNCAAIPAELVESTLYGHRRGAFTGAGADFQGLVRACQGGTLLLDEIGELAPAVQAKLLRFLEEGVVLPVGGVEPVPVDVRVLAATNQDLFACAEAGTFRQDLLGRLEGAVIRVPPLRERREDVLPLFRCFLEDELSMAGGGERRPVATDVAEALLLHDWPRNARTLQKVARRLVLTGAPLALEHLDAELRQGLLDRREECVADAAGEGREPGDAALEGVPGREALAAALRQCDWNLSEVGRQFGRDRRQVYRWLERYGLSRPGGSGPAGEEPGPRGTGSRDPGPP
jgi:DNA-binding NtrC family response regulator